MKMSEIKVDGKYKNKFGVAREVKDIVPRYAWDTQRTALNDMSVKFVIEGENSIRQCALNHFARASVSKEKRNV